MYCRYCTRSRIVGSQDGEYEFSTTQWERAIDYIARTPVIRDVLLSGGDPLLLSDDRLEWVLSRLRRIPHVEFLRIGTKVPAVLPQRITPALTRMLRRYHPLWMSLHFIHPDELTPEVEQRLRPARRCRHPARQPDAAARGRERQRGRVPAAVSRTAALPREAVLPVPGRSRRRHGALPDAR